MKITRDTLQKYFEKSLPSIEEIADAFTFHSFEIDSIEGDLLDVKVLPNRAADCNTEEGLARQLAAILDVPTTASRPAGSLVSVTVSHSHINSLLGSSFSLIEIEEVFRRLGLDTSIENDVFTVTPPASRPDLTIPEDLVEEVGQILGYDRIPAVELPMSDLRGPTSNVGPRRSYIPDQARYRGIEKVKDFLTERGFTEISTQSFAKSGDIYLANPLDKTMPALRTSLDENMKTAMEQGKHYAALVLEPKQKLKLFEIGTVFTKDGERLEVKTSEPVADLPALEDAQDYTPKRYELSMYKQFSLYPFITRDIALWVPAGTEAAAIEQLIRSNAGELLARLDQFDRFEKEGRVSYAFRLIFQSMDRTLTDDEVNAVMTAITAAFAAKGYEVR
jgi:phenylalanyl-tRNA synthetase beta subunit